MTERYADKSHILIIDDDRRIRSLAARYLRERDFIVMEAEHAEDARFVLANFEFDALVVDIMMPGETGLEFVADLRSTGVELPVLFLTALGAVDDRLNGFAAGGDDYLPKPFEPQELVMRLQAILRRTQKPAATPMRFQIGEWVYDAEDNSLSLGDDRQVLTTVESNLLRALTQRPGEVMSREELAALCDLDAGERTIDVQVTRLRKKIEEDSKSPYYLQTVRGKGYLLRAQEVL